MVTRKRKRRTYNYDNTSYKIHFDASASSATYSDDWHRHPNVAYHHHALCGVKSPLYTTSRAHSVTCKRCKKMLSDITQRRPLY
jgi:hypothetical protein